MATPVPISGVPILSQREAENALKYEKYATVTNPERVKTARSYFGIPARGLKRRVPDSDRFTGRGKARKTKRRRTRKKN